MEVLAFSLPSPVLVLRSKPAWNDTRIVPRCSSKATFDELPPRVLDMAAARLECAHCSPPFLAVLSKLMLRFSPLSIPLRICSLCIVYGIACMIGFVYSVSSVLMVEHLARYRGFRADEAAQFTSTSIENENGSRVPLVHSFLSYTRSPGS